MLSLVTAIVNMADRDANRSTSHRTDFSSSKVNPFTPNQANLAKMLHEIGFGETSIGVVGGSNGRLERKKSERICRHCGVSLPSNEIRLHLKKCPGLNKSRECLYLSDAIHWLSDFYFPIFNGIVVVYLATSTAANVNRYSPPSSIKPGFMPSNSDHVSNNAEISMILKNLGNAVGASNHKGRIEKTLRSKRDVALPSITTTEFSSLVQVVQGIGNKLDRYVGEQSNNRGPSNKGTNRSTTSTASIPPPLKQKAAVPLLEPIQANVCIGCASKAHRLTYLEGEVDKHRSILDGVTLEMQCEIDAANQSASRLDEENDTLKSLMRAIEQELAIERGANAELARQIGALTNDVADQEKAKAVLESKAIAWVTTNAQHEQRYATLAASHTLLQQKYDALVVNHNVATNRINASKILIRRLGEETNRLTKYKGRIFSA